MLSRNLLPVLGSAAAVMLCASNAAAASGHCVHHHFDIVLHPEGYYQRQVVTCHSMPYARDGEQRVRYVIEPRYAVPRPYPDLQSAIDALPYRQLASRPAPSAETWVDLGAPRGERTTASASADTRSARPAPKQVAQDWTQPEVRAVSVSGLELGVAGVTLLPQVRVLRVLRKILGVVPEARKSAALVRQGADIGREEKNRPALLNGPVFR